MQNQINNDYCKLVKTTNTCNIRVENIKQINIHHDTVNFTSKTSSKSIIIISTINNITIVN